MAAAYALLPLAQPHDAASDPAAVGLMITIAALLRRESRGAHFRTDFPHHAAVARRSEITLDAALAAARELAHCPSSESVMMTNLSPLPAIMLEPLVRAALLEDLGRAGDLTTDAIVPKDHHATTVLAARQAGTVAGLDLAALAFRLIDQDVEMTVHRADGSDVAQGEVIASVSGPARAILTGGADGAQFPLPSERHRHRDGIGRRGGPRPQAPGSSARARRRPACALSKNTPCAPVAAPITASASTTPS